MPNRVSRRVRRRVSRRAGRRVSRRAGHRGSRRVSRRSRRRTRQRGGYEISKEEFKEAMKTAGRGGKALAEILGKTGATLGVAGTQISVKAAALLAHGMAIGCEKGFDKLADGLNHTDDHIEDFYNKISPESAKFARTVHLIDETQL